MTNIINTSDIPHHKDSEIRKKQKRLISQNRSLIKSYDLISMVTQDALLKRMGVC